MRPIVQLWPNRKSEAQGARTVWQRRVVEGHMRVIRARWIYRLDGEGQKEGRR